jgi:hypothetical protein
MLAKIGLTIMTHLTQMRKINIVNYNAVTKNIFNFLIFKHRVDANQNRIYGNSTRIRIGIETMPIHNTA